MISIYKGIIEKFEDIVVSNNFFREMEIVWLVSILEGDFNCEVKNIEFNLNTFE